MTVTTWTPRPVSALRYAGSTATSVLPSPVRISATWPPCKTAPPMSWTSKGLRPSTRFEASRTTAKASGSRSSSEAPARARSRSSAVFALRSASERADVEASSALTASTIGWYLVRVRWEGSLPPKSLPRPSKTLAATLGERRAGEEEEKVGVGGGEKDSGDFLLLLTFEAPAPMLLLLLAPASAPVATGRRVSPQSLLRRSDEATAGLERGAAFGAAPAATRVARLADGGGCIAFLLSRARLPFAGTS